MQADVRRLNFNFKGLQGLYVFACRILAYLGYLQAVTTEFRHNFLLELFVLLKLDVASELFPDRVQLCLQSS